MYCHRAILVVLASVVLVPALSAAELCRNAENAAIKLTVAERSGLIGDRVTVFDDPAGAWDYDRIVRAYENGEFRPHCSLDFAPPAPGGAVWIRFEAERQSTGPEDWVVTFGESQIDEAQLYQLQRDGLFSLKRTGRAVPPSSRDLVSRWPAVGLSIEDTGPTTVYLRLSGVTAPFVSMQLVEAKRFAAREGRDLLMLAAVLGFMVAMLAYNLVIYIRSRLHQCLYYFLYLGCIIVHVVIYDGLAYRFGGSVLSGPLADNLAQAFAIAGAVNLFLFGRSLLRLPETAPRTNRVILWACGALAAALALELAGALPLWIGTMVISLLGGAVLCGSAISFALKGHRPAIYFSLSFLALLIGVFLDFAAFYFPLAVGTDPSVWTMFVGVQQNWSFHIGICAEAVLISFAITYFIRDMQNETAAIRAESDAARQTYQENLAALAERVGIRDRITEKTAAMMSPRSSDEAFLEKASALVQSHIADTALDVAWLARELAVSERSLRRRFGEITGGSPVEFVRRARLEQGHRYLENGTYQTVAEVARAVGISSPGYFARHYREMFGRSPGEVLRKG
tara:strand:+ start:677 stop:2380 length:1704 start_codon:yes stop_codon:yes gene_type:complete